MENSKRISAPFKEAALRLGMSEVGVSELIVKTFEVAAKLKLNKNEIRGVFLRLSQMVTKGKVTADGLRVVLGEQTPELYVFMVGVAGVSDTHKFDNMIRNGKVITHKVLLKFVSKMNEVFCFKAKNNKQNG